MIKSWGSGLAHNQDFAKGEGLESQVKKFYKYIKIGKRGEQISATQTYHRRGLGVEPPATEAMGPQPPEEAMGSSGKAHSRWVIF